MVERSTLFDRPASTGGLRPRGRHGPQKTPPLGGVSFHYLPLVEGRSGMFLLFWTALAGSQVRVTGESKRLRSFCWLRDRVHVKL